MRIKRLRDNLGVQIIAEELTFLSGTDHQKVGKSAIYDTPIILNIN